MTNLLKEKVIGPEIQETSLRSRLDSFFLLPALSLPPTWTVGLENILQHPFCYLNDERHIIRTAERKETMTCVYIAYALE